jgi:hypothetical protein
VPSTAFVGLYLDALREGHADTTDAHLQVPFAVIEADPAASIAVLNAQDTIIRLLDGTEAASLRISGWSPART